MAVFFITINSPIGVLKLVSDELNLRMIEFDADYIEDKTYRPEILFRSKKQLEEYFLGNRQLFDLPIDPDGTDFQHRVWNSVVEVKYGFTKSYIEIARAAGSEKSSRAVGMANARNPLPIVIPCHRIIGNNGKLTGYTGGLERKKWLLLHEQKHSGKNLLFKEKESANL